MGEQRPTGNKDAEPVAEIADEQAFKDFYNSKEGGRADAPGKVAVAQSEEVRRHEDRMAHDTAAPDDIATDPVKMAEKIFQAALVKEGIDPKTDFNDAVVQAELAVKAAFQEESEKARAKRVQRLLEFPARDAIMTADEQRKRKD